MMGHRLSKIYTRTGDDGLTQVEPKNRIPKNCARIEALGTVDELNCAIGLTLAHGVNHAGVKECLTQVQHDLFNLGGELCPPHYPVITDEKISQLEQTIDEWNDSLPPLKEFILPGGNLTTASCHLARAICRRAERCLITLHQEENMRLEIIRYINRLSDLLFVAARILAKTNDLTEVLWDHDRHL
jgi:cob(I)alamin adenosyltransferase